MRAERCDRLPQDSARDGSDGDHSFDGAESRHSPGQPEQQQESAASIPAGRQAERPNPREQLRHVDASARYAAGSRHGRAGGSGDAGLPRVMAAQSRLRDPRYELDVTAGEADRFWAEQKCRAAEMTHIGPKRAEQVVEWMKVTPGWSVEDYDVYYADLHRCGMAPACLHQAASIDANSVCTSAAATAYGRLSPCASSPNQGHGSTPGTTYHPAQDQPVLSAKLAHKLKSYPTQPPITCRFCPVGLQGSSALDKPRLHCPKPMVSA